MGARGARGARARKKSSAKHVSRELEHVLHMSTSCRILAPRLGPLFPRLAELLGNGRRVEGRLADHDAEVRRQPTQVVAAPV